MNIALLQKYFCADCKLSDILKASQNSWILSNGIGFVFSGMAQL